MTRNKKGVTWEENPVDIIMLRNNSSKNYTLELPTGRYRLDAGRRMRTLRSILKLDQVQSLIKKGDLVVE